MIPAMILDLILAASTVAIVVIAAVIIVALLAAGLHPSARGTKAPLATFLAGESRRLASQEVPPRL